MSHLIPIRNGPYLSYTLPWSNTLCSPAEHLPNCLFEEKKRLVLPPGSSVAESKV